MQKFGRYEIIQQIGAGAMGAVYKARDPVMGG
jgi:serine/threonine protein kinase